MRRRNFMSLVGGPAAWPLAAHAQQQPERKRLVGVLLPLVADDDVGKKEVGAFVMALQQAGWSDGRNARFEVRWAGPIPADIRRHAAELVALRPDVVLAYGSSTVGPLLQITRTVPIVFPVMGDPVAAGYVESLARPGGSVTGFMNYEYALAAKWLELLKEMVPTLKRVAVLRNASTPTGPAQFGVIQAVSPYLKVDATPLNVRNAGDFEPAIAGFAKGPGDGMIVGASDPSQASAWPDCATPIAGNLRSSRLRRRRRAHVPCSRSDRSISASGRLCRSHPERREPRRPTGADSGQICPVNQPQDREGARHRGAAFAARPRRRGDRVDATLFTNVAAPAQVGSWHHPEKPESAITSAY